MKKGQGRNPTRYQIKRWALAGFLLALLTTAKLVLFRAPQQAEAYHARVAQACAATPGHFGAWVSIDAPVPEAAITMLRPNITVSKRYTNVETGQAATLLLVQCKDARDIFGHYPPVCYAAHGYHLVEGKARDWAFGSSTIHGMQYMFSSTEADSISSMIIYDFMILPNGTTCRDMESVYASARDARRRRLGAGQLQVLFDAAMPEDERDKIFESLLQSNSTTLNSILDGEMRS